MRTRILMLLLVAAAFAHGAGCAALAPSRGGGQTKFSGERRVDPRDIAVPPGYRVEVVTTDLNMPTAVAFDADNRPFVTESGYSYGEVFFEPRLLRIDEGGAATPVATGEKEFAPWNGVQFHDGAFYVAEGGELGGGRISRIDRDGKIAPLIRDLPSRGDHHTNGPAISRDGFVYFGVGTATNSAIVGIDNYDFGWLKRHPDFHDIPARDITLAGVNETTENPFTPDDDDEATTGAFVPFGTATKAGQVIKGRLPSNGAVMRVPLKGGEPELVAWGLRNPYGLAFAPADGGKLLVIENMYDVRGSRPVWGTGDLLRVIEVKAEPLWYGWPDFHGQHELTWSGHFQPPGKPAPKFVLAKHPNPPPEPAAKLGVHAGAAGLDVSRSNAFGHAGEAFVATFGDLAPKVGKVEAPVGYQVVRVTPQTGVIQAFAVNRGKVNGPASRQKGKHGGFERPVAARFDRTGEALYIVDFGVMTVDKSGPKPRPNTGVLWRVVKEGPMP